MLYSEAMGRCMNPECHEELFINDGDIMERAHVIPYCDTKDNSFDNLIILCPNCHTKFDKLHLFSVDQIREWKRIRKTEIEAFFRKKFATFEDLRKEVAPILLENKTYFDNYFSSGQKELWDKIEGKILVNNKKLRILFENNLQLFQTHPEKRYSNLNCIYQFIAHVNEFEATRADNEKSRELLFPVKINSMFGIEPIADFMIPSTETLEMLIEKLNADGRFEYASLGHDAPHLMIKEDGKSVRLYLIDTPRLRQMYFDYGCPIKTKVRLESLNFALKYINNKMLRFEFISYNNLREIELCGKKIIFVYEYCLSEAYLINMIPDEHSVIVNLHNWNGEYCISQAAYNRAKQMNVMLLTMNDFYDYISELKNEQRSH